MTPDRTHTNTLIRQAQAGSIPARNQLIEENMGLIRNTINKLRIKNTDPGEHLYAATQAFIRCIKSFDPDKGFSLSTYASRSMTKEIYRQHNLAKGAIRVPDLQKRDTPESWAHALRARTAKRVHGDMGIAAPIAAESPHAEIQGKLWEWVADFPAEYHDAIRFLAAGMSVNQIKRSLDCGWDTVKERRHDALYALKFRAARSA